MLSHVKPILWLRIVRQLLTILLYHTFRKIIDVFYKLFHIKRFALQQICATVNIFLVLNYPNPKLHEFQT